MDIVMKNLTHQEFPDQLGGPERFTDSYTAAIRFAARANSGVFKIQNILVPANSLASAQRAFECAHWFAAQSKCKITVFYGGSDLSPEELQEEITKAAGIEPAQFRSILVCPGRAGVLQITSAARAEAADLIIIPADFYERASRLFLASPMEKLVQHAPCPILIVGNHGSARS